MERVSDRLMLMSVKLDIEGVMMTAVSACAPQVWYIRADKDKFWRELDEVAEINTQEGEGGDRDRALPRETELMSE